MCFFLSQNEHSSAQPDKLGYCTPGNSSCSITYIAEVSSVVVIVANREKKIGKRNEKKVANNQEIGKEIPRYYYN